MEAYTRFANQSQGRDRIFRAAQYACALLRYVLRNHAGRLQLIKRLQALESNMSSGRKLFRLGNAVSSIEAAQRALHLSDPVLRLCLSVTHLSRALYFLCDNMLWAHSVGILGQLERERWSRGASRSYLLSITISLLRDAYVLGSLARRQGKEGADEPGLEETLLDVVKNVCDVFIPLDQLGLYQSNPGVVGLCGLLSSLIGILTLLKPNLKLKP